MVSFPTSIDAFNNPTNTDSLDTVGVVHNVQHSDANDAIEALETKVGITGSADTSSLDYIVNNDLLKLDQTTPQTVNNGSPLFAGGITPDNIQMDITPTTGAVATGQMSWNAGEETLDVRLNSQVNMQVGQEQFIRVVNKTGVQLNDGQAVRISGAQGNRPTAVLAQANTSGGSVVIGICTQNIPINEEGFVTTHGIVNGYDTSNFSGAGAYLYLSSTTPGILTDNITSTIPEFITPVAIAMNKTNNGAIFVSPFYPRSTDGTLAGNSNSYSPSEKAIKTYADTKSIKANTGTGSPEGVITSRYIGDMYIDTNTDMCYINTKASGNTGRQLLSSTPA